MKLFCFPHAGGFSSYYNFMKKYEFCNIDEVSVYEYPGRGVKHELPKDSGITERVERAAEELLELGAKNENYIIFGHSMGSFVGYETAKLLSEQYCVKPALVIMSGQNPPCVFERIKDRFDTGRIDVYEFLEKLGGVPDFLKACPSALNFYMSFICEDMNILSGYDGDIPSDENTFDSGAVFHGDNDPIVFPEFSSEWNRNFRNVVSVKRFEGGHFYMENNSDNLCIAIDRTVSKITTNIRRIMK